MSYLLLNAIEYGGYISIVKFVGFLILFFLWVPLLRWVHEDADAIENQGTFWTSILLGTGAAAIVLWMCIPVFIVGMVIYLIAVGGVALFYVKYRNTRVLEFDRVLNFEHLRGMFSTGEQKKLDTLKSFLFVTANDNQIPMPRPKTSEFFGYRTAYDLFNDAQWRRADTVLLSPTAHEYNVIYQVDGVALKQPSLDKDQVKHFIHFIKGLADLDIKEKRKPQKGNFKIKKEKDTLEWRVTTAGSTAGEQVQLKLFSKQDIVKLPELGLTDRQQAQLNEIRDTSKAGVFIVTGPAKSGVTSTFYALLRNHDAFLNSIDTLERQPTADLPNITQRSFDLKDSKTASFAQRLLSTIRMGPDIVGVAGCKDKETAQVVCQAAKNGIVLYLTLSADNVLKALTKWIELVGDRDLAINTLSGISCQRILRKLCSECKQAYAPNKEILRKFNLPADKVKVMYRPGKVQYDKHGKPIDCPDCQATGFIGRTGVFEVITIDDQLRDAMKQTKSIQDIAKLFRIAKMLYMQQQALQKVIDGTTAINEVIRALSAGPKRKPKAKK